jgi:type I restriction enzyme M protein
LRGFPGTLFKDRREFERALDTAAQDGSVKLPTPARKAVLAALSERDESAAICLDADGTPEPDPELRDTESIPLPAGGDPADDEGAPASVRAFFDREVKPHVPDAWIDAARRDPKDGRVGLIGYEINFNRYFYRYTPPRPLEAIEADIRAIEGDIVRMLAQVTAPGRPPST